MTGSRVRPHFRSICRGAALDVAHGTPFVLSLATPSAWRKARRTRQQLARAVAPEGVAIHAERDGLHWHVANDRTGQACEDRFGRISPPFPPAVVHRLLLFSLTAAIE